MIDPIEEFNWKRKLLIREVRRWVGVAEMTHNDGEFIRMFQKWVDHVAVLEPWCMSFVQFCVGQTDVTWQEVFGEGTPNCMYSSEGCLKVWNETPKMCRSSLPGAGLVVIWQHDNSWRGHTGVCVSGLDADSGLFQTVEGNTDGDDILNCEGVGVYMRSRSINGDGSMKVKGFLNPWGHLDNVIPFNL